MAKNDLRIDILGTNLTISTDEEREYLEKLLGKYKQTIENVQRLSGLKDPLKIAVLTGFLLCDDLEKSETTKQKTNQSSDEETGEAERLTLHMISRLSDAVPEPVTEANTADSIIPETAPEKIAAPDLSNAVESSPEAETITRQPEEPAVAPVAENTSLSIYKLQNPIKNYEWGSPEWIPALLGQRNLSRIPWAELWMGVNSAGPSRIVSDKTEADGSESGKAAAPPPLLELIEENPEAFLGKETAKIYGTLPFLFKIEAVAKPLSIQAHPNRAQAQEGFERENREGIPVDAPNRNYRDSNHRPELFCALSPLAALCGFRQVTEINALIEILCLCCEGVQLDSLESLVAAIKREDGNPYKNLLTVIFSMEKSTIESLGLFMRKYQTQLERDFPEYSGEWKLCSYLAGLHHGDPGILAPLYLNIIELAPGEAMYIPAGIFHAYIHGMGIELMADSDNVLRGGLTSKHVDREELFRILDFSEYRPEILKVPEPAVSWYTYPSPAGEFSLTVMQGERAEFQYHRTGPSIVLLTEGTASVSGTDLSKGDSVFIPAEKSLIFSGTFTAYAAGVNENAPVKEGQIPAGPAPKDDI